MEYFLDWLTVTDTPLTDKSLSGDSRTTGTFGVNPLDSDSNCEQNQVQNPQGASNGLRPNSRHISRPTTPIEMIDHEVIDPPSYHNIIDQRNVVM